MKPVQLIGVCKLKVFISLHAVHKVCYRVQRIGPATVQTKSKTVFGTRHRVGQYRTVAVLQHLLIYSYLLVLSLCVSNNNYYTIFIRECIAIVMQEVLKRTSYQFIPRSMIITHYYYYSQHIVHLRLLCNTFSRSMLNQCNRMRLNLDREVLFSANQPIVFVLEE